MLILPATLQADVHQGESPSREHLQLFVAGLSWKFCQLLCERLFNEKEPSSNICSDFRLHKQRLLVWTFSFSPPWNKVDTENITGVTTRCFTYFFIYLMPHSVFAPWLLVLIREWEAQLYVYHDDLYEPLAVSPILLILFTLFIQFMH